MTRVEIVGHGVAGLCAAHAFAERGCAVTVVSRSRGLDATCTSWWAGGMLAPDCEMEAAEPLIGRLGAESVAFWTREAKVTAAGTLVVAAPRDAADLRRFAARTANHERLEGRDVAALEPDLEGRFPAGLLFPGEGHLDPRATLRAMAGRLAARGVVFETREAGPPVPGRLRIDARGPAARDVLADLRGVRGEILTLRTAEVRLTRTVRLLHPRWPIYVVPRGDGRYTVGATEIESGEDGPPRVRGTAELLAAAVALHPSFAEAEILEIGAGLRPAFRDNLPRLRWRDGALSMNGLYRHGFLCAPALARRAAEHALDGRHFPEVMDENRPERTATSY